MLLPQRVPGGCSSAGWFLLLGAPLAPPAPGLGVCQAAQGAGEPTVGMAGSQELVRGTWELQELLAGVSGLPHFVHSGAAFSWKAAWEGEQGCFPRGCGHRTHPASEQAGGREAEGSRAASSPGSLGHLGVIFCALGIPRGWVAAPAEVSSSCAMGEGRGAGSAAGPSSGRLLHEGWALSGSCPLPARLASRHQNLQGWSREEGKAPDPLSQSLPLRSARWVQGQGLGLWVRLGCPHCWQCSGAVPSPRATSRYLLPRVEDGDAWPCWMPFQSPFPWRKDLLGI